MEFIFESLVRKLRVFNLVFDGPGVERPPRVPGDDI